MRDQVQGSAEDVEPGMCFGVVGGEWEKRKRALSRSLTSGGLLRSQPNPRTPYKYKMTNLSLSGRGRLRSLLRRRLSGSLRRRLGGGGLALRRLPRLGRWSSRGGFLPGNFLTSK